MRAAGKETARSDETKQHPGPDVGTCRLGGDMVVGETITFHCSLEEFVAQIAPLIESRKWTVNDCHEVKPFLRSLDTVMKVCPEGKEEPLALGTLVNGVMEYLSTRKDD